MIRVKQLISIRLNTLGRAQEWEIVSIPCSRLDRLVTAPSPINTCFMYLARGLFDLCTEIIYRLRCIDALGPLLKQPILVVAFSEDAAPILRPLAEGLSSLKVLICISV